MLLLFGVVFIASAVGASADLPPVICVDDRVGVDARARAAFDQELAALTGRESEFGERSCSAFARILISIRTHAPRRYATALGLTWTAGGRVLPVIELYTTNVVKALEGHAGSERFGRALARVAFHELRHYQRQEKSHDHHGLFTRTMNASALLTRPIPAPR
jgi:hypothetical protein